MKHSSSRQDRALRLLSLAVLAAAVFAPALARSQDPRVIDFDAADNYDSVNNITYGITGANSIGLPASAKEVNAGGGEFVDAYNPNAPLALEAGYTGPAIYGGYWANSSNPSLFPASGKPAFNRTRIDQGFISLGFTNVPAGTTVSGSAFIAFQIGGTTPYAFSANSALSMNMTSSNADARFAVEAGGQWYVSATNWADTKGIVTLSGTDLLTGMWAAWNPDGGPNGRLADTPGTFGVLGSSLTDIQAAGFLADMDAGSGDVTFDVSQFSADLSPQAVPEPSTVAMLSLGAAALFAMAAGRRRALFPPKP